jgi:hypothetical protein
MENGCLSAGALAQKNSGHGAYRQPPLPPPRHASMKAGLPSGFDLLGMQLPQLF